MTTNAALAGAVLGRLVGWGVRDFVVCAGARNVPLVSSLLARSEALGLRVFHHFDERAASFFALGLAKRGGAPAAVLTTSGTAAAELLPSAVEAHYSGLPLVLVTADRPSRYRGSGAPQAIDQLGLFGPYAETWDLSAPGDLEDLDRTAFGLGRTPLHLNVAFEEPQVGDRHDHWSASPPRVPHPDTLVEDQAILPAIEAFVRDREGLLVILGELADSWRAPVERFVCSLGAPVWAEASSGLRESADLSGQMIFGEPPLPRRVLRIGGVPSLRLWRDLETNESLPVLSLCLRPFPGLARPSQCFVVDRFPIAGTSLPAGRDFAPARCDEDPFVAHPRSEPALVRMLSREIPSGAVVYLGNSLPIREWNFAATVDSPHPRCFASRGANGIDGQVATFLGLSEGEEETWCLVGDLTALYDLNALAFLGQLSPGRRRIVVVNNGGGRIFTRLPSMAGLAEGERNIAENRHNLRFEAWAAMWGMDYRLWRGEEPFPGGFGEAVVIEVVPDECETAAFWQSGK